MNIKEYIINNFKDSDENEIKDSIVASIESNDEVVLPGLGVLFEILWNNISITEQDKFVTILKDNIKRNNS